MSKGNELGKKIKELRQANGFTQEQLAEKLGIDSKHLSRIELGHHIPNYAIMQKIAKIFNFNLFALSDIKILPKNPEDKTLKHIIKVYKNAESEEERKYYLEAIKQAHKCFKLAKSIYTSKK